MPKQRKRVSSRSIEHQLLTRKTVRKEITDEGHEWFFATYLTDHLKYESAPFHHDIIRLTETWPAPLLVISAFRGSAKSTICSLSLPLWAILGRQQAKFVLLIAQTQSQAAQIMSNIRYELENNELLRRDRGSFEQESDSWNRQSIVLRKQNARITVVSVDQSIRGLKHGNRRPDLIILDDVEDLSSVRTQEGRDKTYRWFTGDVLPIGHRGTHIVVIGNILHRDSLVSRLSQEITEGSRRGVVRRFPLLNEYNECLWPAMYPTLEAIDDLRRSIGDDIAFRREYLLEPITDDAPVLQEDWLNYYDKLPDEWTGRFKYLLAVDLAISNKTSADYTAIVCGVIYEEYDKREDPILYILPDPINARLQYPEAYGLVKSTSALLGRNMEYDKYVQVCYEEGGTLALIGQQLKRENIPTRGFAVNGQDKRSRLTLTTPWIKAGKVKFHRTNNQQLIQQLLGFGSERHDDLADAFALLVRASLIEPPPRVRVYRGVMDWEKV